MVFGMSAKGHQNKELSSIPRYASCVSDAVKGDEEVAWTEKEKAARQCAQPTGGTRIAVRVPLSAVAGAEDEPKSEANGSRSDVR
jgi:hypothetical protein